MSDKAEFQTYLNEAQFLLSKNEGCHRMHGSFAGIKGWEWFIGKGIPLDDQAWANISFLLNGMRRYDKTKSFEKMF